MAAPSAQSNNNSSGSSSSASSTTTEERNNNSSSVNALPRTGTLCPIDSSDSSDVDDDEVQFVKEIPPPGGYVDDEVQIVTEPFSSRDPAPVVVSPIKPTVGRAKNSTADDDDDDDDDVELIGDANVLSLPHLRCHCTVHPYRPPVISLDDGGGTDTAAQEANLISCDLCYCYVCDGPVKDCTTWNVHCEATDAVLKWKMERERWRKRASMPAGVAVQATFGRGVELKIIVDCFRHFLKKAVVLRCDADGIKIDGLSSTCRSVFVQIRLERAMFAEYDCMVESTRFGCATAELWANIRSAKQATGPVLLEVNTNDSAVSISCDDIPASPPIAMLSEDAVDRNDVTLPQDPSDVSASIDLPSSWLKQTIDRIRKRGDKGEVMFECKTNHPLGTGPVIYVYQAGSRQYKEFYYHGQRSQCRDVSVSVKCDFCVRIMLQTLRDITRVPSNMAPRVTISLGPDRAAVFDYSLLSSCWRRTRSGSIKYNCPCVTMDSTSVPK